MAECDLRLQTKAGLLLLKTNDSVTLSTVFPSFCVWEGNRSSCPHLSKAEECLMSESFAAHRKCSIKHFWLRQKSREVEAPSLQAIQPWSGLAVCLGTSFLTYLKVILDWKQVVRRQYESL